MLELARQIERIAGFTELERGITVNPGVMAGGTRSNVVAAEARAEIDIRVRRLKDAPALEKKFRELRPYRPAVHHRSERRSEPAADGALGGDGPTVPHGAETGARVGRGAGGIVSRAAARTAISPPRLGCPRWTAWAGWAKARTRPTRAFSSTVWQTARLSLPSCWRRCETHASVRLACAAMSNDAKSPRASLGKAAAAIMAALSVESPAEGK